MDTKYAIDTSRHEKTDTLLSKWRCIPSSGTNVSCVRCRLATIFLGDEGYGRIGDGVELGGAYMVEASCCGERDKLNSTIFSKTVVGDFLQEKIRNSRTEV